MRKSFSLFIALATALSASAQTWIPLQNFPGPKRDDGVGVVVNNTLFCGTGLQEGWSLTTDFYGLDLNTHTWKTVPSMPIYTERQYACAFTGNNCFYVFGGDGVGGALNNLYKFDVNTQTWTTMNSKPGAGLIGASCLSFGDKVIIVGGKTSTHANAEVWEYTLSTNTWAQKNNFPFVSRWRASQAVVGDFGYLLFGIDSVWNFKKELYQYNSLNDMWTLLNVFPTPKGRGYAAMQKMQNNELMVFGGYDSLNVFFNDVWLYDLSLNTWTQDISLPAVERKGGMSVAHNNQFYYTCGIDKNNNRLNETWLFDLPLSVKENSLNNFINVYPTLIYDVCVVEVNLPEQNNITLDIIDINGKVVKQFLNIHEQIISLSLEDLPEGIYVMKLKTDSGKFCAKKIVKE